MQSYLYHSVSSAKTAKSILQSGYLRPFDDAPRPALKNL